MLIITYKNHKSNNYHKSNVIILLILSHKNIWQHGKSAVWIAWQNTEER